MPTLDSLDERVWRLDTCRVSTRRVPIRGQLWGQYADDPVDEPVDDIADAVDIIEFSPQVDATRSIPGDYRAGIADIKICSDKGKQGAVHNPQLLLLPLLNQNTSNQ